MISNMMKTEPLFITGLLFLAEITEFLVLNGFMLYNETGFSVKVE